jgi:hypothetical protein
MFILRGLKNVDHMVSWFFLFCNLFLGNENGHYGALWLNAHLKGLVVAKRTFSAQCPNHVKNSEPLLVRSARAAPVIILRGHPDKGRDSFCTVWWRVWFKNHISWMRWNGTRLWTALLEGLGYTVYYFFFFFLSHDVPSVDNLILILFLKRIIAVCIL